MGDDAKRLADLIESVADGNAVDWPAEDGAVGESLRQALRDLRAIQEIARIHRSEADEEPEPLLPQAPATAPAAPPAGSPPSPPSLDGTTALLPEASEWGHFVLRRRIGEGSFGEVFEARDTWLDHAVALKLLKGQVVDRPKFLHEARTLARIRHEHVVSVYGADMHDGRVGFWMEFINGLTLSQVVTREGPRGANEAAIMGQELCRALAAVHHAGIIHRDIKAQNVMRETGGRVVLMDFGAGQMMQAPRPEGPLTGTPLYMAPELLAGHDATPQSDIYALGVLLFYLVTGSFPVQAADFEDLVRAHGSGDRRRLGDLRPSLPDAFVRAVDAMLAPTPAARPASASRAREALETVVVPTPILPPDPRPEPAPIVRRVALWVGGIGLLVVVLLLFGFVTTASFNVTFGRSDGFGAETLGQTFTWGRRTMVPPFVFIVIALAIVTPIGALARLIARLVRPVGMVAARARKAREAFAREHELDDPHLMVQLVAGAGVVVLGIVLWVFWDQATAFSTFVNHSPREQFAPLEPANQIHFDWYWRALDMFVLAYGSALLSVYRYAGQLRASIGWPLAAGAGAILVLALVMWVVPYRIVYWNEFERVDLGGVRCYDIGSRGEEVLLHCPDNDPPRNQVVGSSDPRLVRSGVIESVFSQRD